MPTQAINEETRQLYHVFSSKLRRWDLSKRDRLICDGLLELTFAQGLMSVHIECLEDLSDYLEIHKSELSRGLLSLQSDGVVQIRGPKRGSREYRLLPNAELVEPAPRVAPAAKLQAFARIMAANTHGPGVDPGGQLRLVAVRTDEEHVKDALAAGSVARAIEPDETGYIPESLEWYREQTRRSIVGDSSTKPPSLGNAQRTIVGDSSTITSAALRVHVLAPETLNVNNEPTANVERYNVGDAPGEERTDVRWSEDAEFALREVQGVCQAVPGGESEFKSYFRKWKKRCAEQPQLITEAAAEVRLRIRTGERITKPGGYVFNLVNRWLKPLGKSLKIL